MDNQQRYVARDASLKIYHFIEEKLKTEIVKKQ